jgi:hypothetical protein
MENACAKYDAELAAMGISLSNITSSGVEFIYNEVGWGGRASAAAARADGPVDLM